MLGKNGAQQPHSIAPSLWIFFITCRPGVTTSHLKFDGGSKCSFWCSYVSRLESLVFLWPRRVYGGSGKASPFRMFPTVEICGSLPRNARFGAPTCLVSSLWFSGGFAMSMGEAAKHLLFQGFQAGCDVVLPGRRGTLWHSDVFCNVSKVESVKIGGSLVRNARFWCYHVSRLESLVFLWHRRVYRGSCKTSPFRRFPSRLSYVVMSFCVAGMALY